jgi:RTX calcium-binding nonapeptide repeat (4 copies)
MGNEWGGNLTCRRTRSTVITFALVLVGLITLAYTSIGSARARPKCFGQTATIVGTSGNNEISGTAHKDVIFAGGGNDTIEARNTRANHGRDIICGGPGNDEITGNNESEKLIGGPGNDVFRAGNGNDLVVGDNANPKGNESGPTGKDDLAGSGGRDFMVGDNYGTGNVRGGASDKNFRAAGSGDTVIGDSASVGSGNATGGGDDRMGGASGNDLVIGDSYTVSGTATGGGDDDNNSGPGADLAVGDSYTKTGTATSGGGSASDAVHAADGGDFDVTCKPANSCADVFYGDSYRAACAQNRTVLANATVDVIQCEHQNTEGGGPDLLNSDQGNDFMNGGLPYPDDIPGTGDSVDRCDGGTGTDTATSCKPIKRGFEHKLSFP